MFGSSLCEISLINYTNIVCTTQPSNFVGEVDVLVEFNNSFNVSLESGFQFLSAGDDIAAITDIQPKTISLVAGIQF